MRWSQWLVGWLVTIVLAGGVAYVVTDERSPLRPFRDPVVTETTYRDVVVLPEGQAEVSGTVTRVVATGAVGPPLPLPLVIESGTAEIEGAVVDGQRVTIAWSGGRPLRVDGTGGVDLGPTTVRWEAGTATWPLDDGVRVLLPGRYSLDGPVAVGDEGLAEPRDGVALVADDDTTIETTGWSVTIQGAPLELTGPGSVTLEGDLVVRTRDGERRATRLHLPDGPFVVAVDPDGRLEAVVRGELEIT